MPEPTGVIFGIKEALLSLATILATTFAGWKMFLSVKIKQIEANTKEIKAMDNRVDELEKDRVCKRDLDQMGERISGKIDEQAKRIHLRIDDLYREMPKRNNDK